jgi:hypothetical protein
LATTRRIKGDTRRDAVADRLLQLAAELLERAPHRRAPAHVQQHQRIELEERAHQRVLPGVAQPGAVHLGEPLEHALALGPARRPAGLVPIGEGPLQDRLEDLLLAVEVVIDQSLGYTRLERDLLDRGLGVAGRRKAVACRVEKPLPRPLGSVRAGSGLGEIGHVHD